MATKMNAFAQNLLVIYVNLCFLGYWRMLEFEFIGRVIESVVSLKDEQSWSINKIPITESMNILEDIYPRYCISK